MAKVALLIGVSEYEPGLTSLPGAIKDVEAMQRVLQHPEMGAFAASDVKVLKNPERQEMEEEIQALFDDRHKDDLVLFFFSGHGIKDDNSKFYLSSRKTRKTARGVLVRPTATVAAFLHENIKNCRSRRKVIILDCCFSGAFAEGMLAKDDGSVDIKGQLGSEGSAVLTSSSSTEYSFEQKDSELSVYTRYLVEGLETGDADQDRDGLIAIGELHEYAKRKVQEVQPEMKPEIYPSKEGYNIRLARVPSTDPALRYRREIERLAYLGEITFARRTFIDGIQDWLSMPRQDDVRVPSARRKMLEAKRQEFGLSSEAALKIETDTLQPYRDFYQRLESYEQELINYLRREKPLKDSTRRALRELQHALRISDEQAVTVEQRVSRRIRYSPSAGKQPLQGIANSKLPSLLTYVFSGILVILASVYLAQLLQARQQLDAPSINSAQQSPVAPDRSQSPSDPAPSPTSSNPAPSSDTKKEVNDHNQKGVDYYNSHDYQNAIQEFNQAITLKEPNPQPEDAYLYVNRGNAYFAMGNKQAAIQDYKKAITFKPDDENLPKAYEGRGDARQALYNDKPGAISDYEEARRLYVERSKPSDVNPNVDRVKNKLQLLK
jgi:tetratricopeptide (TPR) repeat protein